jgi:hypothetical protein
MIAINKYHTQNGPKYIVTIDGRGYGPNTSVTLKATTDQAAIKETMDRFNDQAYILER